MKKVYLIISVLVFFSLTSCTDETTNFEERIENEKELQLIDKDDVELPDDRD